MEEYVQYTGARSETSDTALQRPRPNRPLRLAQVVWAMFLGAFCAQAWVLSVVSLGWVLRWARREVIHSWWRRSGASGFSMTWNEFASAAMPGKELAEAPNWIVRDRFWQTLFDPGHSGFWSRFRLFVQGLAASLMANFKTGFASILNVWVLTWPGCLLWQFSWYDGWNNSFNKGYEQAAVGPLMGIAGVVLFIAAMLYLPMAQIRQAVAEDWRVFYQFKTNWKLIRRSAPQLAGLGILFSLFTLPAMIIKTVPGFLPQINPSFADLPANDALKWLNGYFFWTAFPVFGLFFALRWITGKIYARALWKEVSLGGLSWDDLSEAERACLKPLIHTQPLSPERGWLTRFMLWVFSRLGRVMATFAVVVVWFSLVAQIYITEFLKYNPVVGWLNQPMVHLPWNHYVPHHLKTAAKELQNSPSAMP